MNESGTTYEGSLLLTLEEVSQLVAHSHHSSETLTNVRMSTMMPSTTAHAAARGSAGQYLQPRNGAAVD